MWRAKGPNSRRGSLSESGEDSVCLVGTWSWPKRVRSPTRTLPSTSLPEDTRTLKKKLKGLCVFLQSSDENLQRKNSRRDGSVSLVHIKRIVKWEEQSPPDKNRWGDPAQSSREKIRGWFSTTSLSLVLLSPRERINCSSGFTHFRSGFVRDPLRPHPRRIDPRRVKLLPTNVARYLNDPKPTEAQVFPNWVERLGKWFPFLNLIEYDSGTKNVYLVRPKMKSSRWVFK